MGPGLRTWASGCGRFGDLPPHSISLKGPDSASRCKRLVRIVRRVRKPPARVLFAGLATLALLPTGCRSLLTDPPAQVASVPAVAPVPPASPDYPVVFPDVLELKVAGKPECSGRRLVYPDGRIDLGPHGAVFAEGCTAAEITHRVATAAGVPAQQVLCRVADARSRFVYVLGAGAERPARCPTPDRNEWPKCSSDPARG